MGVRFAQGAASMTAEDLAREPVAMPQGAEHPFGHAERRSSSRTVPSIGRAFIYLGKGIELANCEVLNISNGGAKIFSDPRSILPSHFVLLFSIDASCRRTCRVIWRDGPNVGVAFEDGDPI